MSPRAKARGGIDLGGTKIQTVIVGARSQVLGEARTPTPHEGGPEAIAEAMADCLTDAANEAGYRTADLIGVGVGSPGEVDAGRGIVTGARNLSQWNGSFALAPALEEALGAPVHDASFANGELDDILALMSAVDDYVGVSNTNTHLRAGTGGAMRVLVPHPPEWRWGLQGDRSPWFPTARVERQQLNGRWD